MPTWHHLKCHLGITRPSTYYLPFWYYLIRYHLGNTWPLTSYAPYWYNLVGCHSDTTWSSVLYLPYCSHNLPEITKNFPEKSKNFLNISTDFTQIQFKIFLTFPLHFLKFLYYLLQNFPVLLEIRKFVIIYPNFPKNAFNIIKNLF